MSEMINRADIAACARDGMFRDIFNQEERHDIIRVIIDALREPTDEMLDYRDAFVKKSDALLIWQHQIDEALR